MADSDKKLNLKAEVEIPHSREARRAAQRARRDKLLAQQQAQIHLLTAWCREGNR